MASHSDTYFGLLDGLELAEALWKRVSRYYEKLPRTRAYGRWVSGYQAFHGLPTLSNPWDMTVIGFDGAEGELSNLQLNHTGNVGSHIVTMTCQQRPSWQVITANTDAKSIAQTSFVSGLLDYFLYHQRIEEYLFRSCKTAVACGTGYQSVTWDPRAGEVYDVDPATDTPLYEGNLVVRNFMPWDVVLDLSRRDANHDWTITRHLVSRWDLAARHPNLRDEILRAQDDSKRWLRDSRSAFTAEDANDEDSDLIPVWTFFHKRTDACPSGRWAELLNGRILLGAGPLPYDDVPVLRITAGEILNTGYGDTPLHACLSAQELLNRLVSAVATNNIAFGTQIVCGPDDASFSRSELAEGLSYLALKPGPNGELPMPQALNLVKSSPETYKLIEIAEQAIETLSGVNSVVRGDPAAVIKSGAYAALVSAQAMQFTSDLQASYQRLIEGTGNFIIQHLKRFAKSPRLAIIAGKTKSFMQKEFNSDDLQGIDRVMVQSANPVTKSPGWNLQMADTLVKAGLIKSPDEFLTVVQTGSLAPLTEAKQLTLLTIRQENEMISDGKKPRALIIDDHRLHILEHASTLANPEMRGDDPRAQAAQEAATAHIMEHIEQWKSADPDLLMALGLQGLPDGVGAPPQGPPGPDQGGPEGPQDGPGMPDAPPPGAPPGPMPSQPQFPMNPATGQRWSPGQ
jgi:hypothetical protein